METNPNARTTDDQQGSAMSLGPRITRSIPISAGAGPFFSAGRRSESLVQIFFPLSVQLLAVTTKQRSVDPEGVSQGAGPARRHPIQKTTGSGLISVLEGNLRAPERALSR
jgi:hypothetical protein